MTRSIQLALAGALLVAATAAGGAAGAPASSLPAGAKVVSTIRMPAPADPEWLAVDANNLWVHGPDAVVRVDPSRNAVVAEIPTGPVDYGYLTSGLGSVWQTYFGSRTERSG
ncbi:MAG TPA: hypothetical protein VE984_05650 [Gaiellaceae bacterium]|nr:hypothetical protein [Gaiellaceae bacterium]